MNQTTINLFSNNIIYTRGAKSSCYMAYLSEIAQGRQLQQCIICGADVKNSKWDRHLRLCIEQHGPKMKDMVNCPINPMHVVPLKYLNHHLEGNCNNARNELKNFLQDVEYQKRASEPPAEFLASVPKEILSHNNRILVYLLRPETHSEDLEPGDIGDFLKD